MARAILLAICLLTGQAALGVRTASTQPTVLNDATARVPSGPQLSERMEVAFRKYRSYHVVSATHVVIPGEETTTLQRTFDVSLKPLRSYGVNRLLETGGVCGRGHTCLSSETLWSVGSNVISVSSGGSSGCSGGVATYLPTYVGDLYLAGARVHTVRLSTVGTARVGRYAAWRLHWIDQSVLNRIRSQFAVDLYVDQRQGYLLREVWTETGLRSRPGASSHSWAVYSRYGERVTVVLPAGFRLPQGCSTRAFGG